MSWSFYAIGKPTAVAAKARDQIENGYKCSEPEESICVSALNTIAAIADSTIDAYAVKVEASGSQYSVDGVSQHNQLRLIVEPVHGFLE